MHIQRNQIERVETTGIKRDREEAISADDPVSNKKPHIAVRSTTPFDYCVSDIFSYILKFLNTESRGRQKSLLSFLR